MVAYMTAVLKVLGLIPVLYQMFVLSTNICFKVWVFCMYNLYFVYIKYWGCIEYGPYIGEMYICNLKNNNFLLNAYESKYSIFNKIYFWFFFGCLLFVWYKEYLVKYKDILYNNFMLKFIIWENEFKCVCYYEDTFQVFIF